MLLTATLPVTQPIQSLFSLLFRSHCSCPIAVGTQVRPLCGLVICRIDFLVVRGSFCVPDSVSAALWWAEIYCLRKTFASQSIRKSFEFRNLFFEWRRSGSNRQPPPCKGGALPVELRPRDKLRVESLMLSGAQR